MVGPLPQCHVIALSIAPLTSLHRDGFAAQPASDPDYG